MFYKILHYLVIYWKTACFYWYFMRENHYFVCQKWHKTNYLLDDWLVAGLGVGEREITIDSCNK